MSHLQVSSTLNDCVLPASDNDHGTLGVTHAYVNCLAAKCSDDSPQGAVERFWLQEHSEILPEIGTKLSVEDRKPQEQLDQ